MKINKNFMSVIIALIIICAFSKGVQAQSMAYRNPTSGTAEEGKKVIGWKAVKLNDDGTNVRNGVEFYIQKAECTKTISTPSTTSINNPHQHSVTPDRYVTEKVALLKLVNTNSYAVKVSYQESNFGTIVNILVPPATTIEGVCGATDTNLAKLVITYGKTDEERQKQRSSIKSSLSVSKIQ